MPAPLWEIFDEQRPLRHRRILLVVGVIGVALSGARTTRARDPKVDLDSAAYGGSTTGGWTCGPTGTAKYAGLGVNATLSEHGRLHPDGPGLLATAGAAVEREVVDVESCFVRPDIGPISCTSGPVALAGMHARLGGGVRWFGLEAGALAYQGWPSYDLSTPRWAVWPELKMRFGPPTLHGVLGFGSDLPTTLRRPAFLYTGVGANFDWGGFDIRGGFNRAGPALLDDFAPRLDAVMKLRVLPEVFIAPGTALQVPDKGSKLGWEASLGVQISLSSAAPASDP